MAVHCGNTNKIKITESEVCLFDCLSIECVAARHDAAFLELQFTVHDVQGKAPNLFAPGASHRTSLIIFGLCFTRSEALLYVLKTTRVPE